MKIGIVGAGGMAAYHYTGFTKAGAKVIALADGAQERAAQFASERGIPKVHASLEEMLSVEHELDAVSICTPNAFHKPLSITALQAGKHVFCEKPPALNAEEMNEMLLQAEKAGKHLMFNFNNRARPESRMLRDYIEQGKAGKINSAQALWIRRAGIPGFGGWFTNKALSGGGPVIDLIHMLDLALYFMNYPEPTYVLSAAYNNFMDSKLWKGPWNMPDVDGGVCDVESASHAFIKFKTGQCLFARASWAEFNERERVSCAFQGEKAGGKVERIFEVDGMDDTSKDACEIYTIDCARHVNTTVKVTPDESMGRVSCAANFVEAVSGKAKPFSTAREALSLMKIVDAIYKSAKNGEPVAF